MNLQEAVGWLLENNALPFQSTANYAGGVEIAMSTLINPSPAKVRVGSIIFFADSKVSTVVGVTSNSFIVSDQYNDLVDDVVYVSNVAINASGHLIVTLSNGTDIDAGFIKQVSNFSINASQHLIVNYNDGTTTDLGAIFNGNVNIAGNFTADSIIENMNGYSFAQNYLSWTPIYCGVCKNGNKLTAVIFGDYTATGDNSRQLGYFRIPTSVYNKLYPYTIGSNDKYLSNFKVLFVNANNAQDFVEITCACIKDAPSDIVILAYNLAQLTTGVRYFFRIEQTFLLSDNLAQ